MNLLTREFEALVAPLGMVWAMLLAAAVWAMLKRRWKLGLFAGGLVLLLNGVCNTPLVSYLLARLEAPYDRSALQTLPSADAVVMLGGTHGFSERSILRMNIGEAADRLLTAGELMRRGVATNLVLGGAKYGVDEELHADSELVVAWFRLWQVPVGQVHELGQSRDTHDEAARTAALVAQHGWKHLILVSSAYHLRRGEATFRKLGLDVTPVGCDFLGLDARSGGADFSFVPRATTLTLLGYWIHEQIGWWYYRWKGWL